MKLTLVFALLVQSILLVGFYTGLADATTSGGGCPCLFDGNDSDDCTVWGSLDGELKPWSLADQACLDAYQIAKRTSDPAVVCASATSFVNGLKDMQLSPSELKYGLGISYGGFWEESSNSLGVPVLKDTITIDGTSYDCTVSESDCYNAMKPYFESNAEGIQEMSDVCDQLEIAQRNARELEQATVRVRICQDDRAGTEIVSECSAMYATMSSDLQTLSEMNCGGFGMGLGDQTLPDCDASLAAKDSSAPGQVTISLLLALHIGAMTCLFSL